MKKEIWKDVEGFEDYEVSTFGKIVSKNYKRKKGFKKELALTNNGHDYLNVKLPSVEGQKTFYIHRLIAIAFIPNPKNKPSINHIDGDKSNNNVDNLEWATYAENQFHSYNVLGKKSPNFGKRGYEMANSIQVKKIQDDGMYKTYGSITETERDGFCRKKVARAIKNNWKYKFCKWEVIPKQND